MDVEFVFSVMRVSKRTGEIFRRKTMRRRWREKDDKWSSKGTEFHTRATVPGT